MPRILLLTSSMLEQLYEDLHTTNANWVDEKNIRGEGKALLMAKTNKEETLLILGEDKYVGKMADVLMLLKVQNLAL